MGQFSRDLMVIAFLGGHIAFHPMQCVRPIYQSASLSRLELSRIRVAVGGVDVARGKEEKGEDGERGRQREKGRPGKGKRTYVCACARVSLRAVSEMDDPGGWREREKENDGGGCEKRRRDVDRAATGNPSAAEHSSPLGGRALPDCRREVAEVWPRS